MSIKQQIKDTLKRVLPKRAVHLLRNEKSLTVIPYSKRYVISDLFPFKITDNWETHFELLNLPGLIDPVKKFDDTYKVKFVFFDPDGNLIHEVVVENQGFKRKTVNIGNLIREKSKAGYGTFACFHYSYLPALMEQGGFITERGYVGYANHTIATIKGYVHGNLDAVAMNDRGKIICLAKSFRFEKHEYRLQHYLEGAATYEFGFVNASNSAQEIEIKFESPNYQFVCESIIVPSKGIRWVQKQVQTGENYRMIISSKLNLPRPVIFRIENNSFDVFHG